MDRLTYERYGCSDNIIKIDLHNGYTIIAIKMWNHEEHYYEVEYRITENTVDRWDFVNPDERNIFKVDYKLINSAILKDVFSRLVMGFFKPYIDRSRYELYCFEKGNEMVERDRVLMEKERQNNVS